MAVARTAPAGRLLAWRRRGELPESAFGFGLVVPALVVTLVVLAYPLGYSLWISLHDVSLGGDRWTWVGLDNYRAVVEDPLFWPTLRRTVAFAAVVTALTVTLGIAFAMLLNQEFRGRRLLRGIMILPWSLSQAMLALTFGWIFNSNYGPLNGILQGTGVIDDYVAWFENGTVVLYIISVAVVWNLVPLATLLFLGSLQTVPRDLVRAAKVDGARPLRVFFTVTLPWIRQTMLVVIVLAVLNGFLTFAPIYVLTGGGPGTDTTLLAWWGYERSFRDLSLGEGAAVFYVMTLLIATVAVVTVYALGRQRHP
jgi:multiple sugar transport system permease protein